MLAIYDESLSNEADALRNRERAFNEMYLQLNRAGGELDTATITRDFAEVLKHISAPESVVNSRLGEMMLRIRSSVYGAFVTTYYEPSLRRKIRWESLPRPDVLQRLHEGYKKAGVKKANSMYSEIQMKTIKLQSKQNNKRLFYIICLAFSALAIFFTAYGDYRLRSSGRS